MQVRASRAVFGVVFAVIAVTFAISGAAFATHSGVSGTIWLTFGIIAAVGIGLAVEVASRQRQTPGRLSTSDGDNVEENSAPALPAHPYRMAPSIRARLARARVSAPKVVGLVLACLLFTAAALPFALHLPRWVELEAVLGGWWLVWATVLAVLAHRGHPLDRTYSWAMPGSDEPTPATIPEPRKSPPASAEGGASSRSDQGRWGWLDWLSLGDAEGVLLLVLGALVLGLAYAATFVLVELAAPLLFFLSYAGIRHALRRSIAADHRGRPLASLAHGAAWATVYVAPLAATIVVIHAALR